MIYATGLRSIHNKKHVPAWRQIMKMFGWHKSMGMDMDMDHKNN
jgi:hypothetical protein